MLFILLHLCTAATEGQPTITTSRGQQAVPSRPQRPPRGTRRDPKSARRVPRGAPKGAQASPKRAGSGPPKRPDWPRELKVVATSWECENGSTNTIFTPPRSSSEKLHKRAQERQQGAQKGTEGAKITPGGETKPLQEPLINSGTALSYPILGLGKSCYLVISRSLVLSLSLSLPLLFWRCVTDVLFVRQQTGCVAAIWLLFHQTWLCSSKLAIFSALRTANVQILRQEIKTKH